MLFQKTCLNQEGQRLATPVWSRFATRQTETPPGLRRDGGASATGLGRGDWIVARRPPAVSGGTSQEREQISMAAWTDPSPSDVSRDLAAGLVVFLVALPLCLGVALASNAPLFSGLVAGIVGGILVGILSGSQASVSGPAAGLTAVVAAQIAALGSFQAFLLAVIDRGPDPDRPGAGPGRLPRGLLPLQRDQGPAGRDRRDPDPETDPPRPGPRPRPGRGHGVPAAGRREHVLRIRPPARGHPARRRRGRPRVDRDAGRLGAGGGRSKRSNIPAPLVVVLLGVGISLAFRRLGGRWAIEPSHLVQVPVADSLAGLLGLLPSPDFSQWADPAVYIAAVTIAAVASLETLLNLEAVDKLDPLRRTSHPSRELLAQGIGNMVAGLIGGLPITSVIVRSSVNINAGGRTKLATIVHGVLLLVSVVLLPAWLNLIPLSCLAAILLVTGVKLASPALVKRMWDEGRYQFVPFALTVVSIVLTDLLIGVLIGLAVSIGFILRSNVRRPLRRVVEKHLGGEVIHIELANQVSFLNRAALARALDEVPRGGHVLLDAQNTDYIDPDLLSLIRDFKEQTAPARGVEVSLLGFRRRVSTSGTRPSTWTTPRASSRAR